VWWQVTQRVRVVGPGFRQWRDPGTCDVWIDAAMVTANAEKSVHTVLCRNNSSDNSLLLNEKTLAQQIPLTGSFTRSGCSSGSESSPTEHAQERLCGGISVLQIALTFTAGDGFKETLCVVTYRLLVV